MEAVKAYTIPKHTREAAGPTGPRIDEKTPTASFLTPVFIIAFSDHAYNHIFFFLPLFFSRLCSTSSPRALSWEKKVSTHCTKAISSYEKRVQASDSGGFCSMKLVYGGWLGKDMEKDSSPELSNRRPRGQMQATEDSSLPFGLPKHHHQLGHHHHHSHLLRYNC